MSSPQHQSFNHRENRHKKFSDRDKISKPKPQRGQDMHLVDADNSNIEVSIFPVSSGTDRRLWPSRKVTRAKEVVRYMSSVPSYLQRDDNGHNIQEMALNVGVLDWRQLKKWTDHDKLVANKTCRESPSSIYASSMFSTFHSSSHSSRSNASPPAERKQSSAFDQRKGRRKVPSAYMIKSQREDIICLPSGAIGSEQFAFAHSTADRDAARLKLEKLRISTEQESCMPHLDSEGGRTNSLHLTAKDRRDRFEEIISGRPDAAVLDRGSPRKMSTQKAEEKTSFERGRGKRSPIRQLFDPPRQRKAMPDCPDVVGSRNGSRGRRSPVKWLFDPPRNSASSMYPILNNPDMVIGARSSSRGRRSPLRQMFDPPRMSSASVSSTQQPHEPSAVVDLPPYARHSPSIRQALLKLSRKNGLPLLMFSSSDDNILVATMHRKGNSDMNICDCVYVIHTALTIEVKKKNGAWLSHGPKGKKPEFACKFVAELIVSCSERVSFDLSHRSFIREFVLVGDELAPTNRADADADAICLSSTELAAIVVESSNRKSGSSSCAVLCECSLCIQRIVAILPNGAHGFSDTFEPSTLIERWESGGSCDCGGWDEGCALTILTNNYQEMIDGILGFDLFTEGDARKGKQSFSMTAFKEDMFTVEFKASIPLLQAFAVSIAMLHNQNPGGRGTMHNHSVEINGSEDLIFDNYPWVPS